MSGSMSCRILLATWRVSAKNGGFRLVEPNEVPPKDVFVPFTQVTTDIEQAVKDAQVIMLVVPGYAVDRFAEVLAPVVREDQIIFFNGAAAMGCVRFTRKARAMGIDTRFKVCEANSLSYGTRVFPDEARVELSLRVKKLFLAAYPKENTEECLADCVQLYPGLVAGRDIWETTLENGNPEVHPGPCLLSAGHIEYSGGEFWLYREGITEHTVNVLHAIEQERMAIGRAFGFELEDAVESRYRVRCSRRSRVRRRSRRAISRRISRTGWCCGRIWDESVGCRRRTLMR